MSGHFVMFRQNGVPQILSLVDEQGEDKMKQEIEDNTSNKVRYAEYYRKRNALHKPKKLLHLSYENDCNVIILFLA